MGKPHPLLAEDVMHHMLDGESKDEHAMLVDLDNSTRVHESIPSTELSEDKARRRATTHTAIRKESKVELPAHSEMLPTGLPRESETMGLLTK